MSNRKSAESLSKYPVSTISVQKFWIFLAKKNPEKNVTVSLSVNHEKKLNSIFINSPLNFDGSSYIIITEN